MSELVRYDAMCRAIDACLEADEVKDIRDKAMALALYAKQAKNYDAERRAVEIRVRAERKAGTLLRAMEKAKGARGNPGGRGAAIVRSDNPTAQPKTLAEMGISKDQSAEWQRLAEIQAALTAPEMSSARRIIAPPQSDGEATADDSIAKGKELGGAGFMLAINEMINDKAEFVRLWGAMNDDEKEYAAQKAGVPVGEWQRQARQWVRQLKDRTGYRTAAFGTIYNAIMED
jgi:hypothetical protein